MPVCIFQSYVVNEDDACRRVGRESSERGRFAAGRRPAAEDEADYTLRREPSRVSKVFGYFSGRQPSPSDARSGAALDTTNDD